MSDSFGPYAQAARQIGLDAIVETLTSADWTNPEGTAEELFKEFARFNYQTVYSKFMTQCLMFWLAPEEMRRSGRVTVSNEQLEFVKKTEQTFDVMWIAFERWMARGTNHYAEVATALGKFYTKLRWGMALQQSPDGIPPDLEKQIAEEAYHYLVQVRRLVNEGYSLFGEEMEPILYKLKEINPDIMKQEKSTTR